MDNYDVHGGGELIIGREVNIGNQVRFVIPKGSRLILGDYVSIGDSVSFVIDSGVVNIGDWTTLHNNVLLLCGKSVDVGQHCWFGQNAVLDGTGGLSIGNGVRVGMYSQIWSHVAAGEQIEGCILYGSKPVVLEDDVWLVGTCTVGSGVTIGRRAICMNGSNVTKNVERDIVVAGLPAKPRLGLNFYKVITLNEKFEMLLGWLKDFVKLNSKLFLDVTKPNEIHVSDGVFLIMFFKSKRDFNGCNVGPNESKFEIETKEYSKSFTSLEKNVMKFLSGNKARFYSQINQ